MDNQVESKSKKRKLSKVEKTIRISSKGRTIKTPANLLTTSSDEAPTRRKLPSAVGVKAQLARLQNMWKEVEIKKSKKKDTSSEDIAITTSKKDVANTSIQPDTSSSKSQSETPELEKAAHSYNLAEKDSETSSPKTTVNSSKTPGNSVSNLMQPSVTAINVLKNSSNASSSNNDDLTKGSSTCGKKYNENRIENSSEQCDGFSDGLETFYTRKDLADFLEPIEKSLKAIKDQTEEISQQNKQIMEKMEIMEEKFEKLGVGDRRNLEAEDLSNTLYNPLKGYPISTVEEFNKLNLVENKEKRRELYSHLVRLGGMKLRDFLNCAVKTTMTDKLVCCYTWVKQAQTERFGDTRVAYIFFKAAQKCWQFAGPKDVSEFKHEIMEVFRATKQRYRNSLKKINPVEPSTLDDEEDIRKQINDLQELINSNVQDEEADDEISDHNM